MLMYFASLRDSPTIAPHAFPGLPIFLPRCDHSQALVLGFMSPLSRVGQRPTLLYRFALNLVYCRPIRTRFPPTIFDEGKIVKLG